MCFYDNAPAPTLFLSVVGRSFDTRSAVILQVNGEGKNMFTEKIDLYKYFGLVRPDKADGYLTAYVHDETENKPNRIRPAILVIGGGGYAYVSQREKECVALSYLAQGFNAFTLQYSVAPATYPAQLNEGLMAIIYIRENAAKYGVDKEHVAAIGFSAGGHLCAMLATLFDSADAVKIFGNKTALARPDAVVLSYPVITWGESAHKGSFDNLCGENESLKQELSLEKRVKANSSPAFIWATANDAAVPVENSLYYALACKKHGVPFELCVFEDGQHGLSLANEEVFTVNKPVQKWFNLSVEWLHRRGFVINDCE